MNQSISDQIEWKSAGLTERRSTIHPDRTDEESLTQCDSLKHLTPLPHGLLLLRNMFHPLPLAHIRRCPQSLLVEIPAEVNKGYAKAALGFLDGDDRRMREVPKNRFVLLSILRCSLLGEVIWSGDEKEFKRDRLYDCFVSRHPVCRDA